jgi:hypothetical protein
LLKSHPLAAREIIAVEIAATLAAQDLLSLLLLGLQAVHLCDEFW